MRPFRVFVIAAALAAAVTAAHAGRSCEEKALTPLALERGLGLAERTVKAMDASGAQVLLIARAGQDLSRYDLRWSHMGLAYREADGWRIVHKLNHCGAATAALYRQGVGQFFLDDPWRYQAAVMPLAPELQSRVLATLRDNRRVAALNTPAYNMLAYPWSQRYQQSNQWAIETLASAADPGAETRERAQAWLKLKGYEPSALHIDALTRLGARLTRANVAFDDHPNSKRFADRIETVTADSVFAWMQKSGLGGTLQVIE